MLLGLTAVIVLTPLYPLGVIPAIVTTCPISYIVKLGLGAVNINVATLPVPLAFVTVTCPGIILPVTLLGSQPSATYISVSSNGPPVVGTLILNVKLGTLSFGFSSLTTGVSGLGNPRLLIRFPILMLALVENSVIGSIV